MPILAARPKITAEFATLKWTYPRLKEPKTDTITDPKIATELLATFNGILKPQKGSPYDTPFYDLVIDFKLSDGRTLSTSVYLPRTMTFPGMWKHPESKALEYFDDQNGESRNLVRILRPYIPPVYPTKADRSKSIPFKFGIPDFTEHDLPISGDFPPGTFSSGG
ncbi:MAG: hypothetical protein JSR82_16305 [Verrucomicrobia bacterium]|nr:hypothetical protein [Verrucomicrobiota bacterium]